MTPQAFILCFFPPEVPEKLIGKYSLCLGLPFIPAYPKLVQDPNFLIIDILESRLFVNVLSLLGCLRDMKMNFFMSNLYSSQNFLVMGDSC